MRIKLRQDTGEAGFAVVREDRQHPHLTTTVPVAVAMDEPTHTALSGGRVVRVHAHGSHADGGMLCDESGRECATVVAALLYGVEVALECIAEDESARWDGWTWEVGGE